VQKVNTKAELQLRISEAPWIPGEVREHLARRHASGLLIIKGDEERSQVGNQEACLLRLVAILKEAARTVAPAPTTKAQQHHVSQLYAYAMPRCC
jgi:protein subunit release factor B